MNAADTLTLADWRIDRAKFPPVPNVTEIQTLDGRRFAWTHGLTGAERWEWVRDLVAAELECSPDLITCTDDDLITVDGVPCYRIVC